MLVWERATGAPARPVHHLAVPPHVGFCDELRHRGLRGHDRGEDRPDDRSAVLGVEDSLAARRHSERHARAPRRASCAPGTVDSWVLWHLTGGAVHACDATNASRTQLLQPGSRRLGRRTASRSSTFHVGCCPRFGRRAASSEGRIASGVVADGLPIASADRRFARGALRPGRVPARHGEGHLRHGLFADDVTPAPRRVERTGCRRRWRGRLPAKTCSTRSKATSR